MPPVISRSVLIASLTTKELVIKDFALEPDEKKLLRGASLIIQNLAGNLALVTCREPLKVSFQENLKKELDQHRIDEKTKEDIINEVGLNNLDLGCALIKKAVIETAIEEVHQDPVIIDAVNRRRKSRETGIPFYDPNIIQIYESLPPALRPSPTGLTKDQFRIYEDLSKVIKTPDARGFKKGLKDGRVSKFWKLNLNILG